MPPLSLPLLLELNGRDSLEDTLSRLTNGETEADSTDLASFGAIDEVLLRAPGLTEAIDLTGDLETSLLRSVPPISILAPIVARYCGNVPSGPVGRGRTSLLRFSRFSRSLCFSHLSLSSTSNRCFSFLTSASNLLPPKLGQPGGGAPAGLVDVVGGNPGGRVRLNGSGLMAPGGGIADDKGG